SSKGSTEQDDSFRTDLSHSGEVIIRAVRILIESLFVEAGALALPISPIVEQENRQSHLEQELEIVETVDDIARIAMAPQDDRPISRRLYVPAEQADAIRSLKPHIFQRQPAQPCPVSVLPRFRMIDEELIEHDGSVFLPYASHINGN